MKTFVLLENVNFYTLIFKYLVRKHLIGVLGHVRVHATGAYWEPLRGCGA